MPKINKNKEEEEIKRFKKNCSLNKKPSNERQNLFIPNFKVSLILIKFDSLILYLKWQNSR